VLDDLVRHQPDVLLHFLFFEAPADQPLHREIVFLALVTACRFAGAPTRISPSS
jgi:hypothetical protein